MAKNSNRTRWIIGGTTLALTLAGMIIGGTLAYSKTDNKTNINGKVMADNKESHNKEMSTLKKDGCDPGRQAVTDVAVIKSQLDTMSKKQETMRKENKEAFAKILEKL